MILWIFFLFLQSLHHTVYTSVALVMIKLQDYFSIHVHTAQAPDLKDLMIGLYCKVANKWRVIGVHLRISDLDSIETKHHGDSHSCLLEMLDAWLKRVDSPPTWSAIIEAVEFLGEEQLGRELREKYCP